jgi:hypothetical protein
VHILVYISSPLTQGKALHCVQFAVLAVLPSPAITATYSPCVNRHFGGTHQLHFWGDGGDQPSPVRWFLARLIFDPEDRYIPPKRRFYMAPNPRRWRHSVYIVYLRVSYRCHSKEDIPPPTKMNWGYSETSVKQQLHFQILLRWTWGFSWVHVCGIVKRAWNRKYAGWVH